jgi:hypothetical protein
MNKQSSIEYLGYELNTKLFYNISPELWDEVNKIFEQAKAMHKEEIIDAFYEGIEKESNEHGAMYLDKTEAKQYYKETFGNEEVL